MLPRLRRTAPPRRTAAARTSGRARRACGGRLEARAIRVVRQRCSRLVLAAAKNGGSGGGGGGTVSSALIARAARLQPLRPRAGAVAGTHLPPLSSRAASASSSLTSGHTVLISRSCGHNGRA